MRHRVGIPLCILLFVVIGTAPPAQAIDAALKIETSNQGEFEGESTIPGREQTIEILGYADALIRLIGSNGLPTGTVQCKPLFIRKLIDQTTPKFARAAATSDTVSTFELRFYRPSDGNYFTIELTGARVFSISRAGGDNDAQPSEQIGFVYTGVSWTHEIAGINSEHTCSS